MLSLYYYFYDFQQVCGDVMQAALYGMHLRYVVLIGILPIPYYDNKIVLIPLQIEILFLFMLSMLKSYSISEYRFWIDEHVRLKILYAKMSF